MIGHPKMRGNGRKKAGFTIIELIFAFGIFMTALLLVSGSMLSIMKADRTAESREHAVAYLATIMEQVRHAQFDELLGYTPTRPKGLIVTSVVVECFDSQGNAIRLPVAGTHPVNGLPNPLRVCATVTYSAGDGHKFTVRASALHKRQP